MTDTLAASNISYTAVTAGAAAERAAEKKIQKYTSLSSLYTFVPVAFETLGPVNEAGAEFISAIVRRIRALSGDNRDGSFLWQRFSMAVQRFNSVCLLGTFGTPQDG